MIDYVNTGLLLALIVLMLQKVRPRRPLVKQLGSVVLDSCTLIDGRVLELSKIGFMPKNVVVPQFIVKELQLLADGRDSYKRERARFGLDIVQQLQQLDNISVHISSIDPGKSTTDDNLVALAKQLAAELLTTDFNLNQVAKIEGVTVLNVNELAHALRPNALPGESMEVTILQAGTNRDQGVGYLDDGTMVVVDGARRDIGKRIKVIIQKSHQTVAGKMLFAKKSEDNTPPMPTKNPVVAVQKNPKPRPAGRNFKRVRPKADQRGSSAPY